jgi:hypothetical protein
MSLGTRKSSHPQLSFFPCSYGWPHFWTRWNIFLLRRQCLECRLLHTSLDMSMVFSYYDYSAVLGYIMQGEQGCAVSHGHDHPTRGLGPWDCCLGSNCTEKAGCFP